MSGEVTLRVGVFDVLEQLAISEEDVAVQDGLQGCVRARACWGPGQQVYEKRRRRERGERAACSCRRFADRYLPDLVPALAPLLLCAIDLSRLALTDLL